MHSSWSAEDKADCVDHLATVRDWLRFGVSRLEAGQVVYGHGTDNALDEAAFMVLAHLKLPISDINPWLDASLIKSERLALYHCFERRIVERLPAAYVVGKTYIGDFAFKVDPNVIIPRSFIGELLLSDDMDVAALPHDPRRILDLCTGSGCLAIIAAHCFPEADVVGADICPRALLIADGNAQAYDLNGRVLFVLSDLFAALDHPPRFDMIICNPPYVRSATVDAFAPEYQAEPRAAHEGGPSGFDIVRRVIDQAPKFLADGGCLMMEIGGEQEQFATTYPELDVLWHETASGTQEVFTVTKEQLVAATVTTA